MPREGAAPSEPSDRGAQQKPRPLSADGMQSRIVIPPRIYLDNAATSWPKPDSVYEAVDRYLRLSGAPAGRTVYAEANQANQTVAAARAAAARFIGAGEPRRIVFTLNGTDALNTAIHGLLAPGDHVVTTVAEHNSVLRPLRALEESGGVEVTRVGSNARGFVGKGWVG